MKKTVITPNGKFETLREAGESHGVSKQAVEQRIKSESTNNIEWYYGTPEPTKSQQRATETRRRAIKDARFQELDAEDWRDISIWGQKLKVSSDGRVQRIRSMFGQDVWVLIPQSQVKGYPSVGLTSKGTTRRFYVHRLILLGFQRPGNGEYCNHIDGDKTNNNIENLEYCTPKENVSHFINVIKNKTVSITEYKKSRGIQA